MSVVEDLDLRETIIEGSRKSLKPFGTLGKTSKKPRSEQNTMLSQLEAQKSPAVKMGWLNG